MKLPPFEVLVDGIKRGLIQFDPTGGKMTLFPFRFDRINSMEFEYAAFIVGRVEIETVKCRQKINEQEFLAAERCYRGCFDLGAWA